MEEFLKHPLLLLLVGAVTSGLIIPLISRNWQNRQKSLEIKTNLVSEISQVVMEFFMSVQFVHMRKGIRKSSNKSDAPSKDQIEFDQSYKIWEVKSAVIGTKLEAYITESEVPETWTAFSKIITQFYALEGTAEPGLSINIQSLGKQISETFFYDLPENVNWSQLREAILQCKCIVIKSVLTSNISLN